MIRLQTRIHHWPLKVPFRIAGAVMHDVPAIQLLVHDENGNVGRSEAAGIDYDDETPTSMAAQLHSLGPLPNQLSANDLQTLLPRGGARNALDCALWDLRAKQLRTSVHQLIGISEPRPLLTALTIGLGSDEETRLAARTANGAPLLKIKVSAERNLKAIAIVRQENPSARLVVDANGSWTLNQLRTLLPALQAQDIELIEQPLPRGADFDLDQLDSAIPLAADESCTDVASLDVLVGRYQYANIKLDKCGGLTEALRMVEHARSLGLGLMVGNMCGSSLAMAPAFLVGQHCEYVDLDGPQLQREDCEPAMQCHQQLLYPPPPDLWG